MVVLHTLPAPESDERLMVRVQSGDRRAFEEIYARWRDPVFQFLLRARLDVQAADDALQETFVRVYEQSHRYDPARPFRPWLYTLAYRFGVDQRRLLSWFRDELPPDSERLGTLPGADPTRIAVAQVLARLPQRQRTVLALAADGLTGPEIGVVMNLSDGSARNLLTEARSAFRAAWDPPEVNHGIA